MDVNYPPVSFHFNVSINGENSSFKYEFAEVTGLTAEMSIEEITENGENKFKYNLPTGTKFNNIKVNRGLINAESELATWCSDSITSDLSTINSTKTIIVSLLNENNESIITWLLYNAWTVKWNFSNSDSIENEIIVESIEFGYSYYKLSNNPR